MNRIKKIIKIALGSALLFIITNLLFPQLFSNSLLARAIENLGLKTKNYRCVHFNIETKSPSSDTFRPLELKSELGNRIFALDSLKNLIEFDTNFGSNDKKNLSTEPLLFLNFKPGNENTGDRIIKATIHRKDLTDRFPIDIELYEVTDKLKNPVFEKPARFYLKAQNNQNENVKMLKEFIFSAARL
jgi:hypothetical protein